MTITGRFVLPPDVTLVPVTTIPEERRKFRHEANDWAVTRRRSRAPSRVVDADAAALLREFSEPTTIVDAIVRFSRERGVDAEATLESSYPLLDALVTSGVLVSENGRDAEGIRESLVQGEGFGGWEVVALVQLLDDTELYQVRRGSETAALKLERAGKHAASRFRREARVLDRIGDGRLAPRLIESGAHEERAYLILDWCRGVDATTAAEELRGDRAALADLCRRIVEAYAELHARGVIHGDVHPRNLLVDRDRSVRIIDFGFSRLDGDAVSRAGIPFFHEPELAAAMRARRPSPLASEAGEQYAVAALLYALVTGAHYRDFSLERTELLREVEEEPPLPFRERGVEAWPEMEEVLGRALAKDPSRRFGSMNDFAAASQAPHPAGACPERSRRGHLLPAAAGRRYSVDFENPSLTPPFRSLNFGVGGVAYAAYRVACARGDASLLALADVLITRAIARPPADDDYYDGKEVTPATVGTITPWHTQSGLWLVQAQVAAARGDERTRVEAVHRFIRAASVPEERIDLATGMGGALLAAATLLELGDDAPLRAFGDALHERLWQSLSTATLNAGVAHGWAGVLIASLRWSRASGTPLAADYERRYDEVRGAAVATGRGARWRWHGNVSMAAWCNGSAGLVLLGTLAGDAALAEDAAWNAWESAGPNPSICCGYAGRAYAMLAMYRFTADVSWLDRAHVLADRAARAEFAPEHRDSLYKGRAGVAMLLADLDAPEGASFPLFD